jgi:hypothetical protein
MMRVLRLNSNKGSDERWLHCVRDKQREALWSNEEHRRRGSSCPLDSARRIGINFGYSSILPEVSSICWWRGH